MKTILFYFFLLIFTVHLASGQDLVSFETALDVTELGFGNHYPRIVAGSDDQVYMSWGWDQKVYFVRKDAEGFTDPKQLNDAGIPAYVGDWTGPDLAASGDTVYVTFMNSNWTGGTYFMKSFDAGLNFSAPNNLESYADSASRFATVAIRADGQPIVALMKMTSNGTHPEYVVRSSEDWGETFGGEQQVGGWSGEEAEACDCCPGVLAVSGETVAMVYRDNLNDIRDIWASVSLDGGSSFDEGFPVDNSDWFIDRCPASGPDAVIVDEKIYTVFLSENETYLSKTGLSGGILSIAQLGEDAAASQNFPRISSDGTAAAIVWTDVSSTPKLYFAYTDDLSAANPVFEYQVIYEENFSSADVALRGGKVHVAIEDASGVVKYISGTVSATNLGLSEADVELQLYPNPSQGILQISLRNPDQQYHIFDINSRLVLQTAADGQIDVSTFASGSYSLQVVNKDGKVVASDRFEVMQKTR